MKFILNFCRFTQHLMNDFMGLYNSGLLKDPVEAAKYRKEISDEFAMLEATAKIYEMAAGRYRPKQP